MAGKGKLSTTLSVVIVWACVVAPVATAAPRPSPASRPATSAGPPASASGESLTGTQRPSQVVMPPRDRATPAPEPSAIVRGRVVDEATGLPLGRAIVSARGGGPRGEPRSAATDDLGRYELRRLPAGELFLSASRPGYVTQHLGQRRPREMPRPLTLRDGQVVERADFALARGGVITGRIVDEAGEPVLSVMVSAHRLRWERGRRTLEPVASGTTNDLGIYRIFGLPPGHYLVKGELRMRIRGGDEDAREYAPTFYPGTQTEALAQPVAVAASQESVADFALGLTRLATVTGTVLDSAGRPVTAGRVQAIEVSVGGRGFAYYDEYGSLIAADGTFTIRGLMPGPWLLTTTATPGEDPFLQGVGAREFAALPIEITGEDLNVTLAMAAGGTLRGRVVFEGEPPAGARGDLLVSLRQPDGNAAIGASTARPEPDGRFTVTGVVGRRLVEVTRLPRGWFVREVRHGARDITDDGIEVGPGQTVAGVEVIVSREVAGIEGTVVDDRGGTVSDYTVVAIGEDRQAWFLPSGRHLRTARPDQEGVFSVRNLAPGRYRVLALGECDPDWVEDPEQLERLGPLGEAVTVRGREVTRVTVRLVVP